MGTNRDIKSDGNINITSTQTNISGDLDVTGSINNFNFPASDGINGQALVTNGSGTLSFADAGAGGAGGINYITNTRATADTTGYATYADAAATTPVDGTGGSANITFTRNITTPLRDVSDFKIAKDAANRQGEGIGYAFTINSADKARKLVISFDYDASHASYADDDIKIFIYDVTNTNLIRVNGEDLKGGKGKHYAQFQTASNSTSYRLIFHVSSTNASAYNVFLDEISVGPQTISHGAGGRDVVFIGNTDAGPSIANTTSTVIDFINVERSTHGAYSGGTFTVPESGTYQINSNLTFTSTANFDQGEVLFTDIKVGGVTKRRGHYKEIVVSDSNGVNYSTTVNASLSLNKGDQVTIEVYQSSGGAVSLDSASTLNFCDITKVVSSQASEDLGGRDVAMTLEGLNSGDQALSNATGTKVVNWGAAASDTHGAWDSGNSKYVIPVTGYYQINFGSHVTDEASTVGLTSVTAHIYIDGSPKQRKTERQPAASNCESQVSALMYLTKDQYVEFYTRYDGDGNVDASNDVFNGSQYTFASIHKVASPQTILENETVAARYTLSSSDSIGTSDTDIDFSTKDYDTHGAYSSGVFTTPITGYYIINAKIHGEVEAYAVGEYIDIIISINKGAGYNTHERSIEKSSAASTLSLMARVDSQVYLEKGDLVKITSKSQVATNVLGSANFNSFCIAKIK